MPIKKKATTSRNKKKSPPAPRETQEARQERLKGLRRQMKKSDGEIEAELFGGTGPSQTSPAPVMNASGSGGFGLGPIGQPSPPHANTNNLDGPGMDSVPGLRAWYENINAKMNLCELQIEVLVKRIKQLEAAFNRMYAHQSTGEFG